MNQTPQSFLEILKNAGSSPVYVAAHERPDGDAVSSLSSAVAILRANGFSATGILPDEIPDCYKVFVPEEFIVRSGRDLPPCAVFITIDASTQKRIAAGGYPYEKAPLLVNIDHHPDNEMFGHLKIVDPSCCSAAHVFFNLCRKEGLAVSKENATKLLLGIVTDSGCFRFDNTTPEALRAAADLVELGADHHSIILAAYGSKEENLARLEAEIVLHRIKRVFDGRFAYFVLDPELLARFGVDVRNTEYLIDTARNLAGVELAALLREEKAKGGWKLSMRSKNPKISAGRIARRLSGGGHEMAAGGFIAASSLEESEKILCEQVKMEMFE